MTRRDIEFDAEGVTLRGWRYPAGDAGAGGARRRGDGTRVLRGQGDVPGPVRRGVHRGRDERGGFRQPQLRRQRRRAPPGDRPVGRRSATTGTRSPSPARCRRWTRDRIGIWGSSYSGGHVLVVAAIDRRVKAVVCQVPLISGHDNLRALVRADFIAGFRAAVRRGPAGPVPRRAASHGPGGGRRPAGPVRAAHPGLVASGSPRPARAARPGVAQRGARCAVWRCSPSTSRAPTCPGSAPPRCSCWSRGGDHLTPADLAIAAFDTAHEPKKLVRSCPAGTSRRTPPGSTRPAGTPGTGSPST